MRYNARAQRFKVVQADEFIWTGTFTSIGVTATRTITSTLTLPDTTKLEGKGHANSLIFLANSSNTDMLRSEDFATLTGTGVTLVSAGVPYGFGISGLNFDGNKANQASGDGIKLYGKQYLIEDVLITNVKGIGFYSEFGNDGGDTSTTWKDMPESVIRELYVDSSGSHNFQFRGPHDGIIESLYTRLAGGDGARFEASGATYSGLCDIGFIHSYANTLIGVYTDVKIKAEHIESESNFRHGIHIDASASNCQIGLLELFGNDIGDSSTYWNGLLEAQECVIGNVMVLDTNDSAGGLKITGASTRVSDGVIKQVGNANASAIGVDIDAASVTFTGKINAYTTAGQTGLRTSQSSSRSYLNIDAQIDNCYTGWNNVTATLGGSYKVRINTANKDHLLFTGAGPGTFDLSAGGGVRARDFWDVIATNTGTSHTGTAQAGAAGTITLASSGPSTRDDVYNGCIITTTGGTGSGQVRVISDYVGSTKVASVTPNWTVTPDNTTTYSVATLTLQTRTKGTGTIPSGSTSVTIPHGLLITAMTPTTRNIKISNTNSLGSALRLHISAVSALTFTVTSDADPGATTATFSWEASLD